MSGRQSVGGTQGVVLCYYSYSQLQVIKDWRWEQPGNEARLEPRVHRPPRVGKGVSDPSTGCTTSLDKLHCSTIFGSFLHMGILFKQCLANLSLLAGARIQSA